jgi:hypothetical protein
MRTQETALFRKSHAKTASRCGHSSVDACAAAPNAILERLPARFLDTTPVAIAPAWLATAFQDLSQTP